MQWETEKRKLTKDISILETNVTSPECFMRAMLRYQLRYLIKEDEKTRLRRDKNGILLSPPVALTSGTNFHSSRFSFYGLDESDV